MEHKFLYRILVLVVAASFVLMFLPVNVFAAQPNTPKEEVVYVNLNSDGSVKDIYVVNIFDLDENGQVIDYGRYQSLRNMTTTDEIRQSNDVVTIDAKAGKLYYEGKLDSTVMPWSIAISYYLDGVQRSAREIAGASGALKISISIQENKNDAGNFFAGYALQGIVMLDTLRADHIRSNGATIANVGRNKQLTYTILPGKGAEIEITADVTDFQMEGISFNGIPLEMDLTVDYDELLIQVRQLTDAIAQIDDGAAELNTGAESATTGSIDLKNGVQEMLGGTAMLHNGLQNLRGGIKQMDTALHTLNSQSSALTSGSYEFSTGLNRLQSAASFAEYKAVMLENGLDIDLVQSGNTTVINAVHDLSVRLAEVEAKLLEMGLTEEDIKPIRDGYTEIADTVLSLMTGNNAIITGTQSYLDALGSAAGTLVTEYEKLDAGISDYTNAVAQITVGSEEVSMAADQVVTGSATLNSGTQNLFSGAASLSDGLAALFGGTSDLKVGTSTLRQKTEGMDEEIKNQIDGLLRSVTGADVNTGSFVSDANTNIESVQFVIKTEGIQKESPVWVPESPEPSKSFWQKLLALFGITG